MWSRNEPTPPTTSIKTPEAVKKELSPPVPNAMDVNPDEEEPSVIAVPTPSQRWPVGFRGALHALHDPEELSFVCSKVPVVLVANTSSVFPHEPKRQRPEREASIVFPLLVKLNAGVGAALHEETTVNVGERRAV